MENITAHSIDSLSEKISRKSFRIATVGLILFIIRIPALRQGRRSRSGRFSERAIYRHNGTLIFGFSPPQAEIAKGLAAALENPQQTNANRLWDLGNAYLRDLSGGLYFGGRHTRPCYSVYETVFKDESILVVVLGDPGMMQKRCSFSDLRHAHWLRSRLYR